MNSVKEYSCIVADSICESRILSAVRGCFLLMSTELQQLNGQNKVALWAERISECRNSGMSVKTWCKEKRVCEQTYYKWQKKIFAMAKAQQELQFAEVTPVMATNSNCQIAIKELITLAAVRGNLPRDWLTDFDERDANPRLYETGGQKGLDAHKDRSASAALFNLQSDVIRSIARREDAVIVGRCADYVLRDMEEVQLLTVFISAPFESRVKRKMGLARLSSRRAETLVRETDRQRSVYYQAYTGNEWGNPDRFDLHFDTQEQYKEKIINCILTSYTLLG